MPEDHGGFSRLIPIATLALGCVNAPLYFASPTPILAVTGQNDAMGNPPVHTQAAPDPLFEKAMKRHLRGP